MPVLLSSDEGQDAARSVPHGAPRGAEPQQGVIEEARRHQRARRVRLGMAGLVALVGIAALVWALSGARAPADPGRAERANATAAAKLQAAAGRFGIRLSPALDGGQYGWCVGVQEPGFSGIAGGGCATTPTASVPLSMVLTSGNARTREGSIVVLTTPQVAAVRLGARRAVATAALPGLPYGLRAARIVVPFIGRRSARGRRLFPAPAEPALTPLDSAGRPIAGAPVRPSGQEPPLSAHGPCALTAGGVPGLVAKWSHVASEIAPYPGVLVGRAFFSCIDTEYQLHRWPLDVAILLDAQRPGRSPAPIPGLSPVPGKPGYVNGPGDFKGALTATRRGNAWLVVAGGSGLSQRLELLYHLEATVKL